MQWWAGKPQVLMLCMLNDCAKYRYRCMKKHDADLLQVGQDVLVRMGRRMEKKVRKAKLQSQE